MNKCLIKPLVYDYGFDQLAIKIINDIVEDAEILSLDKKIIYLESIRDYLYDYIIELSNEDTLDSKNES